MDNAATTPLDSGVLEVMTETMKNVYGNPSSIHAAGRLARTTIEDARKRIANHLRASQGEIFFTSSATESNNTAIHGAIRDLGIKRIISSPTEHPCVLNSLERVNHDTGIEIEMLHVDKNGRINLDELRDTLKNSSSPTLVSVMHANNEIGTIQDIKSIGDMCADHGALFHCDTVQTVGKHDIDVSSSNISFLSGSGHKIYGPKGAGFLYVNGNNIIKPLIVGGGQEHMIMMNLDIYGICASAGSACSSGAENASHVIQAIGQSTDRKAMRFSFSHHNTIEEVDYVTNTLKNIL
ncbi:UNVERIFIED_CONTAM: hypothetical protein GTU68_012281 [Idotea baltica]|nr:hypothetical protein [Idotea baltica]